MCFGDRIQRTSNPRFQGKYSYHTDHWENPVRPNSPDVSVMLVCRILRSIESQSLSSELEKTVGLKWEPSEIHRIRMAGYNSLSNESTSEMEYCCAGWVRGQYRVSYFCDVDADDVHCAKGNFLSSRKRRRNSSLFSDARERVWDHDQILVSMDSYSV